MKLFEHAAKEVFARYGIPVPDGYIIENPDDIREVKKPVVLKAQVLTGGRGKAGGIKFADTLEEARMHAASLLDSEINGYTVKKILVEDKLAVNKEYYLSITLDRNSRSPFLIASKHGGVDIESVPEDSIFRRIIDPTTGYYPYIGREVARFMNLTGSEGKQVCLILEKLYSLFRSEDAELVEVNPLGILHDGSPVALDAKMLINDDSLFRHPEYGEDAELSPLEIEARKRGIVFVQLDGEIGVIANGAGLTMATLDALSLCGGSAGIFLDLGGTDDPEVVKTAFDLMNRASPSIILINIFGGITKTDTVARGLEEALGGRKPEIPIVARIRGVNEEKAKEILSSLGIFAVTSMPEAAELTVKLWRQGGV